MEREKEISEFICPQDVPVKNNSTGRLLGKQVKSCDLDVTSEFSGGCTPYKRIARNVVDKQRNNPGKKRLRGKRTVPRIKDAGPSASVDSGDNVKEADPDDKRQCATCGITVTSQEHRDHVKECLKTTFQRSKSKDCGKVKTFLCQICQDDITGLSMEDRQLHINACIDGKPAVISAAGDYSSGADTCQFCQRDLVHLNSHKRAAHLNRCMDKSEEETKKKALEAELLEKARNKVLDCPLCGQLLKTHNSRRTHIKRCGKNYGISATVIAQRMKDQEREHHIQIDAGILPDDGAHNRRRRPAAVTVTSTADVTDTDRRLAPPVSKLDEETQLALALSKSLREEPTTSRTSLEHFTLSTQPQQTNILTGQSKHEKDAFSILMTPRRDFSGPKRKNRKKIIERSYQLVTMSDKHRLCHLEDKLNTMILQNGVEVTSTPELPPSAIKAESKLTNLWDVDSVADLSDATFYVDQLQPQVLSCAVTAGSKLKRMSEIPGWKPLNSLDVTQTLCVHVTPAQALEPCLVSSDMTLGNETLMATTQTAVLLAEMMSTTSNIDLTSNNVTSSSYKSSGGSSQATGNKTVQFSLPEKGEMKCDDEPTGFCSPAAEKTRQDKAKNQLLTDLGSLLDDDEHADVTVVCKHGAMVPAHSFLLALRCPLILKERFNNEITLSQYSSECIQTLLVYIYTADLTIDASLVLELQMLAQRLELEELVTACIEKAELVGLTSDTSDNVPSMSSCELIDRTLQNILHDVWGSDDDDDDDEDEENVKYSEENGSDSTRDVKELELDEIYKLVASQKVDRSDGESDDQSEQNTEVSRSTISNEMRGMSTISFALMQKLEQSFMLDSPKDSGKSVLPISDSDSDLSEIDENSSDVARSISATEDQINVLEENYDREIYADEELEIAANQLLRVTSYGSANDVQDSKNCSDCDESKVVQTPVHQTSKVSTQSEESMPDLFGSDNNDDEALCDNNRGDSDNTDDDTRTGVLQVTTKPYQSPADMFNSYYSDSDDLNCNIESMRNSQFSGENESETESKSNDGDNETGNNGSCDDESVTEIPLASQNSVLTDSSQNLSQLTNPRPTPRKPTEKRKRHSSLPLTSSDEETCFPLAKRSRRKLSQLKENDPVNHPGIAVYDMTHSDVDASPVFSLRRSEPLQKETKTKSLTVTSVVDLTQDENVTSSDDAREDSSEDICRTLGVHSSMNEPILTCGRSYAQLPGKPSCRSGPIQLDGSPEKYGKTSNQSPGDNDTDKESAPTRSSGNSGKAAVPPASPPGDVRRSLDFEEVTAREGNVSGYSAADVWADFDDDAGFDFGLPTTQVTSEKTGACIDPDIVDGESVSRDDLLEDPVLQMDDNSNTNSGNEEVIEQKQDPKEDLDSHLEPSGGSTKSDPVDDMNPEVVDHLDLSDPIAADDFSPVPSCTPEVSPTKSRSPDPEPIPGPSHLMIQDAIPFKTPTHLPPSRYRSVVATPEYDPPTDMDTDVSMAFEDANDSCLWGEHNEPTLRRTDGKTASSKASKKKAKKSWVPPSPFTPMVDYDSMITPDLKKNCHKIGVRVLPKKKMVVLLKDIYHKTHAYETDSDYDGTPPKKTKHSEPQPDLPSTKPIKKVTKSRAKASAKVKKTKTKEPVKQLDLVVADDRSEEDLNMSCSQDSTGSMSDLPEESILIPHDDDDKKLSKKDLAYKQKFVWDYILADDELHLKILHYEPLDLPEFQQNLKSSGLNVGLTVLMDFLDEQNVTFTMKNHQPSSRRGPRKKKSKKATASSQRSTQS